MGMPAASADNPADTDGMINRSSGDKVNEIPFIGGMGVASVGGTTTRQTSFSGRKPAINESKSNLEEDLIRINLQNREFFLIIVVLM